jgi:sugar (pentulose or hexulose) kinase
MSVLLGIDLGTTTITALALDAASGEVLARDTRANDADITASAEKARGRSQWDPRRIVGQAVACLHAVAEQLGPRVHECAGLGITGQQHGVVMVDAALKPLTPFINWQDRRAAEPFPGSNRSYVEEAAALLGPEAPERTGCRLAAGYLGTTLFWLRTNGLLPAEGTACLLGDFFGAALTGQPPVSEPTYAASSGLLNLGTRQWDVAAIDALMLPASLFPPVREAGTLLGTLTHSVAEATGLPQVLPVYVAIGDNQAAFVGSVADRATSVLVNVGTGAQVAAYTKEFRYAPPLETRPFPIAGNLLVNAGLSGGHAYATLERFFHAVGEQLLGIAVDRPLYVVMNELADQVPRGAEGLRCEPLFTGTRANPELRAAFTGASPANFTPRHMVRALLEGMARALAEGYARIHEATRQSFERLAAGGNGLRENAVLARIVAKEFGLPLVFPRHREEAAVGAALTAGVGAGVFTDLAAASRLVDTGLTCTSAETPPGPPARAASAADPVPPA